MMQKNEKKSDKGNLATPSHTPIFFHLEADRVGQNLSLSLMGVLGILDFNDTLAVLKMRRGKIKVSGKELSVSVYENRTVEIIGKVCAVEFV